MEASGRAKKITVKKNQANAGSAWLRHEGSGIWGRWKEGACWTCGILLCETVHGDHNRHFGNNEGLEEEQAEEPEVGQQHGHQSEEGRDDHADPTPREAHHWEHGVPRLAAEKVMIMWGYLAGGGIKL